MRPASAGEGQSNVYTAMYCCTIADDGEHEMRRDKTAEAPQHQGMSRREQRKAEKKRKSLEKDIQASKPVVKTSGFAPGFCRVTGVIFIVAVFVITLPLTLPRLMGYEIYNMASNSMEPGIPVGSALYVRAVNPFDVQVDEIIAFYDEESVVAHRVVVNDSAENQFITKGDANAGVDENPVPYKQLIGMVALHVPMVGSALTLYASNIGKIYLMLTLACGIMLNALSDRIRRYRSKKAREAIENSLAQGEEVTEEQRKAAEKEAWRAAHSGEWVRTVAIIVVALVFVGTGAVLAFIKWQYHLSDEVWNAAQVAYVDDTDDTGAADAGLIAPIRINFDALLKINPDIQGWIYCEGTDINYPVLQGATNDTYLRHDYRGDYNVRGSIFMDAANRPAFVDANTIIYGHHMSSGTMFAMLEDWEEQAYYEAHPYMWLLTPTQDYQVVLVSAHHVSARSSLYQIRHEHDDDFRRFLTEATADSDFEPVPGATVNPDRNYVMLSTCSYLFDDARYVIHGKLVPVNSAGGVSLGPISESTILTEYTDRLSPSVVKPIPE